MSKENKGNALMDVSIDKTHNTLTIEQGDTKKTVNLLTKLPFQNHTTLNRDHELEEIEGKLNTSHRVLLINGIGGIGKTELSKRYFWDNAAKYSNIGWIDYIGSIKESFINSFVIDDVTTCKSSSMKEIYSRILSHLKKLPEDSLLIIDNIEDPKDQELLTLQSLPINIIASSRHHIKGFDELLIDILPPELCLKLFYTHYTVEKDDEVAYKIVELTGYHTLTIELIARIANFGRYSLSELHRVLMDNKFNLAETIKELVNTPLNNNKNREPIYEQLMKIYQLTNFKEEEIDVINNISILPSVNINKDMLKNWLGPNSNKLLRSLTDKGWLIDDNNTIRMHGVLSETARHMIKPCVNKCSNFIDKLIRNLFYEDNENPINKKEYMIFIEYALAIIDEKHERIATMANNLSLIYEDLGELESALMYQKKALAIKEEILDENHPYLAASYNNLSAIYLDMEDAENALIFQKKALDIKEEILDEKHPELAAAFNNMSKVYEVNDQLDNALMYQMKALEIRQEVLDNDNPDLAESYNNLSTIYWSKGDPEKGLMYQKQAIEIREAVLDKLHPDLATSYNNISMIYEDLDDLDHALTFQKKALSIREEVLDSTHPDLTTSYNNLAQIYEALGDTQNTLKYQEKALAIVEKVFDKNHPYLGSSYHNLSTTHLDLKNYDIALDYAEKAVAILKQAFPSGHPYFSVVRKNLEKIKRLSMEDEID